MASQSFPYSSTGLGSDDEGSIGSDYDPLDDDDLGYQPWQPRRAGAAHGAAHGAAPPPPRYPSVPRFHSNAAPSFRSSPGYVTVPACVVCQRRPQHTQNGKSYLTCGLTCASKLPPSGPSSSSRSGHRVPHDGLYRSSRQAMGQYPATSYHSPAYQQHRPRCVVCKKQTVYKNYVTCGLTCIEKLCKDGPSDKTMCNYCHRRPKFSGKEQCGRTCADNAKRACLLCKSRPKRRRFQFCGRTCKGIAMKSTPLLIEIPKSHSTYEMVENKFKSSWVTGTPVAITRIYKVVENDAFLKPYDAYRKTVGPKENYLYHGTKRECQLGVSTTKLCTSATCAICNILKTSYKVEVARQGTFGQGIYGSSASNTSFGYCGAGGAMLLNKVVLGKSMTVTAGCQNCPAGYNSVVYDPQGASNETIVYTNDAIRPVFLIMFQ